MATPWNRGNFVLLSWPFTDGTSQKVRPALVVAERVGGSSDFIALMVTSRFRERGRRWHVCIDEKDDDFGLTGLKCTSYIRCDKIYTFESAMVRRVLGKASAGVMHEISDHLIDVLSLRT